MAQTSDLLSHPIALDCENTFLLAIKLSNTSWVLAAQIPGLPRLKAKQTIEPTAEALLAVIETALLPVWTSGNRGGRLIWR
jgi:hypothetical protein